jgi:hypothetical protein
MKHHFKRGILQGDSVSIAKEGMEQIHVEILGIVNI